ncbi:MAG: GNAT family N-acetyltransferase [Pseudomonadota bacterium]
MAVHDYLGTEIQIRRQQAIHSRKDWIAKTPGAYNGARMVGFDDPERVGWDSVRRVAEEDGLVGFPGARETEILAAIARHLGPGWHTNTWLTYTGTPETVLPTCEAIERAVTLPTAWRKEIYLSPDDQAIGEVQTLNMACDILPYPAYYSRGEDVPIITTLLRDKEGMPVATGSACMRYHENSRLGGCLFIGLISVDPRCRGKRLGSLVNALTLIESHRAFGWTKVHEQVHESNTASRKMIEACGLDRKEDLCAVTASRDQARFSA